MPEEVTLEGNADRAMCELFGLGSASYLVYTPGLGFWPANRGRAGITNSGMSPDKIPCLAVWFEDPILYAILPIRFFGFLGANQRDSRGMSRGEWEWYHLRQTLFGARHWVRPGEWKWYQSRRLRRRVGAYVPAQPQAKAPPPVLRDEDRRRMHLRGARMGFQCPCADCINGVPPRKEPSSPADEYLMSIHAEWAELEADVNKKTVHPPHATVATLASSQGAGPEMLQVLADAGADMSGTNWNGLGVFQGAKQCSGTTKCWCVTGSQPSLAQRWETHDSL